MSDLFEHLTAGQDALAGEAQLETGNPGSRVTTESQTPDGLVSLKLSSFLYDKSAAGARINEVENSLDSEALANLKGILQSKAMAYKEGTVIQFSYAVLSPEPLDVTQRPVGARAFAGRLAEILERHHIKGTRDAFQIIGKNSSTLVRGNNQNFDSLLIWGKTASQAQLEMVLDYMLCCLALSARQINAMPDLDIGTLTWKNVYLFIDALLKLPSGGAYQQFTVASFFEVILDEFGFSSGHLGLKVVTKGINAADASSRTAADVQLLRQGRVEEAFEVTANDWKTKQPGTRRTAVEHDLNRLCIVASTGPEFVRELRESDFGEVDVSALDEMSLLGVMVAVTKKPGRKRALNALYRNLERHQPSVAVVNTYVELLNSSGLVSEIA